MKCQHPNCDQENNFELAILKGTNRESVRVCNEHLTWGRIYVQFLFVKYEPLTLTNIWGIGIV